MDDEGLVKKALHGERDAFEELVRRHQKAILRTCAAMLGRGPDSAEDAAQETFIRAFRNLPRFRGDSSFLTWLHAIAIHQCRDFLRRRAARPEVSLDALQEVGSAFGAGIAAPTPNPGRVAETADLVRKVLGAVREDYREALVLREVEGLTYEEMATALETSVESVRAKLRRARIAVATTLDRLFPRGSE